MQNKSLEFTNYIKTYWGVILNPLRPGGNKGQTYFHLAARLLKQI